MAYERKIIFGLASTKSEDVRVCVRKLLQLTDTFSVMDFDDRFEVLVYTVSLLKRRDTDEELAAAVLAIGICIIQQSPGVIGKTTPEYLATFSEHALRYIDPDDTSCDTVCNNMVKRMAILASSTALVECVHTGSQALQLCKSTIISRLTSNVNKLPNYLREQDADKISELLQALSTCKQFQHVTSVALVGLVGIWLFLLRCFDWSEMKGVSSMVAILLPIALHLNKRREQQFGFPLLAYAVDVARAMSLSLLSDTTDRTNINKSVAGFVNSNRAMEKETSSTGNLETGKNQDVLEDDLVKLYPNLNNEAAEAQAHPDPAEKNNPLVATDPTLLRMSCNLVQTLKEMLDKQHNDENDVSSSTVNWVEDCVAVGRQLQTHCETINKTNVVL